MKLKLRSKSSGSAARERRARRGMSEAATRLSRAAKEFKASYQPYSGSEDGEDSEFEFEDEEAAAERTYLGFATSTVWEIVSWGFSIACAALAWWMYNHLGETSAFLSGHASVHVNFFGHRFELRLPEGWLG